MLTCLNCYGEIEDLRKETRCVTCEGELHKLCSIKDGDKHYCDACYTTIPQTSSTSTIVDLPDVIRRSYIELYKSCPYSFYLEVIKQLPTKTSIEAQIGIDLHEMFEKFSKDRTYTKEQMIEDFGQIWYNYSPDFFNDEKHKQNMYQRAIDSVDTFYTIAPDMTNTVATEEKIIYSIGEGIPKVSITMDKIEEVDGELEMVDWKTGAVMVGKKLTTDLQAPLYIKAVIEKYKRPVRKFTFYYLKENKFRVFERVNDDVYACKVRNNEYRISLTETIREVKSMFSRMKNGDFNIPRDTKKMYFTCKMCSFRQDGTCAGAEEESWKQSARRGW
jgi:RecB family exonuclease